MISDKILYERTDFSFHADMKVKDAYAWNIKRLNWLVRRTLSSGVPVSPIIRELAERLGTNTASTAQVVLNARLSAIDFWETKIAALNLKGRNSGKIQSNKR